MVALVLALLHKLNYFAKNIQRDKKIFSFIDGHMPTTNFYSNNYIGKSNWENNETQYANKDERFRGALFDFRLYKTPMSQAKVDRTILWGKPKLFLD